MKKKTFILLITLSILLTITTNLFAIGGNMGGPTQDGSADWPYLIEDFNDFQVFCDDPNYWDDYTRLDCDLDLDPNLAGRIIYIQAPIAGDTDTDDYFYGTAYAGSFDGNSHVISNLTVDGANYCGLFGKTDDGSSITDLSLENVSVTCSGRRVGGLVGWNDSIITGSYSRGTVTGFEFVGGLVGDNEGIITNSYSTGAVTGDIDVGGLAGDNCGNITNCFSTGTVNGNLYNVGGLVGGNHSHSIINSYSSAEVTGNYYVGGLVGKNRRSIISSYSTGKVTGNNEVGGLVGDNEYGSIINGFWDTQTSKMIIGVGYGTTSGAQGKTTLQMQTESTFTDAGWDFVGETANGTNETWQMPVGGGYPVLSIFSGYAGVVLSGDGSKENPYLIGDANDLGAVIYYDKSGCYKLIADINLADIQWQSAIIPGFTGHFDGDGYIISNMNIDGAYDLGLFGRLYNGAEVANIGLESVMVTGTSGRVAALVGSNFYGIITSSYSTGVVNGRDEVGGLVGLNDSGIITSSYSTGEVNGDDDVGGLVGYNTGSITNCYSRGAVTGDECVGGLVGYNGDSITSSYSSITSSYSTGEVIGDEDEDVGGLVGHNGGSITSSFWDTQTSAITIGIGDGTTTGATGKTTAEMKTVSTFLDANWDLVAVWNIEQGQIYPLLRKYSAFDTNYDNKVNFIDFAEFANNWLDGVNID